MFVSTSSEMSTPREHDLMDVKEWMLEGVIQHAIHGTDSVSRNDIQL